jgi:MFS family permease
MTAQQNEPSSETAKSPLREIVQPFIDLVHAPRALWGVNLGYCLEGTVYFGFLGYLAIYFSDFVFKGVNQPDVWSHYMVMVLTAGITIAMFFFGFVPDKWGPRNALIAAFIFLLLGRVIISSAPTILGLPPQGLWSPLHLTTMAGILVVVIGYGMYQPAAYAAVRQITTPRTAGMAFQMLYALMNLGQTILMAAFLLRDTKYLGLGIPGAYWVYTGFTAIALLSTLLILSKRTMQEAVARAKTDAKQIEQQTAKQEASEDRPSVEQKPADGDRINEVRLPVLFWVIVCVILAAASWLIRYRFHSSLGIFIAAGIVVVYIFLPGQWRNALRKWIKFHPLANGKFAFFIFALMPVQTLFTYNWFILPQYIKRAYEGGWIGRYFEVMSNLNPPLIFVFVPIIAVFTLKRKVYNMMVLGTFIMAAPAFLLALGPNPYRLAVYILLMTIGEAMWQPRFLQYAAEIAPEGRTGQYMGVAQLPWFLTKVLVPLIYSGKVLAHYCPSEGPKDTQKMWLIFACIAICSTVLLLLAKGWIGKDFKTKAA